LLATQFPCSLYGQMPWRGFPLCVVVALGCSGPAPTVLERMLPSAQAATSSLQGATAATLANSPKPVELSAITLYSRDEPLSQASDQELLKRLRTDGLGPDSISVGRPNRGSLRHAVALPERPFWRIINPGRAFATEETIRDLEAAVAKVAAAFPGSPPLGVGDLSRETGGYIRPHRSHQSGRDADVGYYYQGEQKWYTKASAENLDRPRTWQLLKALMSETDVEFVFIDRSIQQLLREYAVSVGEEPAFLDTVFQRSRRDETLVRHEYGHLTHFHVRFYSQQASARFQFLRRRLGVRVRF